MTHPGLAVMLVVGVGLGAVIYYFFASTSEQGQPARRQRDNGRFQGSNNRTCWSASSPNDSRNRRQDQKCPICFEEANNENRVKIIPCMHIFHKQCIEEWRKNGAGEARQCCPVCRDKIQGLEEL